MRRATGSLACAAFVVLVCGAEAVAQRTNRPPTPVVDPKTASIVGRIALPSGNPANRNLKVTLRNSYAPLFTIYSDNNGQFRFVNLAAGIYYVDVIEGEEERNDPVTQYVQVRVGAQQYVTVYLREKTITTAPKKAGGVTSVAELAQEVPGPARKEYEKALKLAKKGKTEQAVEHLKKALSIYPDYHAARNDLGVQYMKLSRTADAIEQFDAAITLNPRAYNPRLNMGLALVESKRYAEAAAELQKAIAIDNTQPAAYLYLGIALLETGELPGAFKELHKSLMLSNGQYAIAYYYMGLSKMRSGEREEAIRNLKAYLENDPAGEVAQQAKLLVEKLQ